jgi:hypothetical protein
MENRIEFKLTPQEQQQLQQHFDGILSILQPKSVVLSDEERRNIPKMADGNLPFVEKAIGFMQTASEFKPNFVDAQDAQIDLNGYKLARQYLISAKDILRILEDISMLSGSEALLASLAYYRNVQFYNKQNQPNANSIYEELATRFVKVGKKGDKKGD